MFRAVITLVLALSSLSANALTPFEQHFLSVSKGMSAFYMYLLSGEDKRFKKDYEREFDDATAALYQSSNPEIQPFIEKWNKLRPTLKYENKADMGASINENIRGNFRSYVVDLYLEFTKNNQNKDDYAARLKRIQFYSNILTARALDVDSTIYGISLFTQHDFQLNQSKVYEQISADLNAIEESDLPKSAQFQIRRIQAKLKFMEASLVDYNSQSATYLLYQNTLSINKIIAAQMDLLSNIASS